MVKKFVFIIISSILFSLPQDAFGADELYRMLHADDVADFKADQDMLIIGRLISQIDDSFTVEVHKVLSGSAPGDRIVLSGDFKYGWGGNRAMEPEVGDYCVMSLKKHGAYYKKAWGIFKATSGDYQTLKLLSEDFAYPYYTGGIAAVEWYVNSGGIEKEFFFEQNRVYVNLTNGETCLIYTGENSAEIDQPPVINTKKSDATLFKKKSVVPSIAVLCAVYAAIIIIKRRRP